MGDGRALANALLPSLTLKNHPHAQPIWWRMAVSSGLTYRLLELSEQTNFCLASRVFFKEITMSI